MDSEGFVVADAYSSIANKFDLIFTAGPVFVLVLLEVPKIRDFAVLSNAAYPVEYTGALLTFRLFTMVHSSRHLLFGLFKVRYGTKRLCFSLSCH